MELIASVSGGTYIRTLIVDLARSVKSSAHMTELRRLQHGPFASDSEGQVSRLVSWHGVPICHADRKFR